MRGSCIIGGSLTLLIPHEYTHYMAVLLFVVFGVKLLKDGQVTIVGVLSQASFLLWRGATERIDAHKCLLNDKRTAST